MKKFEISSDVNSPSNNIWFNECKKRNVPYIIITKKPNYSSVYWDHINLDKSFDSKIKKNEEIHRKKLQELISKYQSTQSKFSFNNLIFEMSFLEHESAIKLAEELYDYLYNFYNS